MSDNPVEQPKEDWLRANPSIYHAIGKLDAAAEILLLVRNKGERAALRELATQLNAASPTGKHCHAEWYLEQHPEVE